jgi:cobalt-zinc-cadmium efflux system outer membrane protein
MSRSTSLQPRIGFLSLLTCLSLFVLLASPILAQTPGPPSVLSAAPMTAPETTPAKLTLEQAVQQALQKNPFLMTVREQHGIAAAAVVIAKTYPYNPLYFSLLMGAGGPESAGITNRVFNEHYIRLDLEVCGQAQHREAAASAALSRADWEIANQELVVAVTTIRAFNALLYRKRKLAVLEETLRLNEKTVEQVRRLVDVGRLRPADLILARTDVDAARAALAQGQSALGIAWSDLRRALGSVNATYAIEGNLGLRPPPLDPAALMEAALHHRPDVQVRQSAVAEAEARWRFENSNRYGNPSVGPAMEYSETRVTFVGMVLSMPLPVLNTRRGEIQQRDAERVRAQQELAQFETQALQDVQAALARLANARVWADSYEKEVLPNLARSRQELEKLFAQGEAGVDALRVIEVQRRYLKAEDSSLDAFHELSQASTDLAAAVGDPALAIPSGSCVEPAPLPHP